MSQSELSASRKRLEASSTLIFNFTAPHFFYCTVQSRESYILVFDRLSLSGSQTRTNKKRGVRVVSFCCSYRTGRNEEQAHAAV